MKREKFLISIIIPAYNEEKNIGQCLQSLKNQNFPADDYEIIVINNVSTDKTGEIAKKMGVKVIFESKKGVAFALKKGFDEAQGKIVAMTDADTAVNPNWLKNMTEAFKKDQEVTSIGGRTFFRPRTFLSVIAEPFLNLGCFFFKIANGANAALENKFYHKIGGLNGEINLNWEADLALRAKKHGKFIFLWNNPVVTSSRHFHGLEGIKYCLAGPLNAISLLLFKKPFFYYFKYYRD